jgi:hypothetical protein
MWPIVLDTSFEDRSPRPPIWWDHTHSVLHGSPSRKKTWIDVTRKCRARSLSEIQTFSPAPRARISSRRRSGAHRTTRAWRAAPGASFTDGNHRNQRIAITELADGDRESPRSASESHLGRVSAAAAPSMSLCAVGQSTVVSRTAMFWSRHAQFVGRKTDPCTSSTATLNIGTVGKSSELS